MNALLDSLINLVWVTKTFLTFSYHRFRFAYWPWQLPRARPALTTTPTLTLEAMVSHQAAAAQAILVTTTLLKIAAMTSLAATKANQPSSAMTFLPATKATSNQPS